MSQREKKLAAYQLSPQLMLPWHPGRTISVEHSGRILGCSQTTVLKMIQEGELEAFKLRKGKKNSPFRVIYESVVRLCEEWRQEVNLLRSESTPDAQAAPDPSRPPRGDR